jgi:hypothetical protein
MSEVAGVSPEDLDDLKVNTSKKELKEKLESRKVKNMRKTNIIAKILEKRKEEFIEKLIPLGHKQGIIETVIAKGLTCLD